MSVVSSETTFPVGSSVLIEALGVEMWSAMSSMIDVIYMWRLIIEVVRSVPHADRKKPPCSFPYDRPEKIFRGSEYGVLPFIEYIPQICISAFPIDSRGIGRCVDSHEIIKVDFISIVILRIIEIQLISHFICEKSGSVSGFLIG